MTSSNENIFRATGHLCGKFTGHRWIPRTKAVDTDVFFDLRMNKHWVNNGEAHYLRRHRAHYDVIVMDSIKQQVTLFFKLSSFFADKNLVNIIWLLKKK